MLQEVENVQQSAKAGNEAQTSGVCKHCDSPIPPGRFSECRFSEFCCAGCEVVFRTITELGLGSYYELQAKSGAKPRKPATSVSKRFAFYNEPEFIARFTKPSGNGAAVRKVVFFLEGIHCAACVWILEKLPEINSAVLSSRVEFGRGLLHIEYLPEASSLGAIASLVNSLGYTPAPIVEGVAISKNRSENRKALVRIGVAGLCAMNVMMMSLSIYQGQISGIEQPYQRLFSWVSLLLTIPVMLFSAVPFYRTSVGGLKSGVLHIDLPIVVAIIGAFIFSVANTITGSGVVYYDSICALVLLLLAGRWVQHRAVERVLDAETLLYAFAPRSARIAGSENERFVEALSADDKVEVRTGETVPVDGLVVDGTGLISTAILTGESTPMAFKSGIRVFAGSKVTSGKIIVTVEAVGRDSRLGRLMQTVERAAHQRAPLELFLDQVSKGFIAAVLVLAGCTFWWWASAVNVERGLECAVALLVVSCPCVLAVATPLTFSVAMSQAAKHGILIKSADAIERLTKIRHVFLDKTGTITDAQMMVSSLAIPDDRGVWRRITTSAGNADSETDVKLLINYAAALESESYHPIAAAIRSLNIPGGNSASITVSERETLPGLGIRGVINGSSWSIQSARGVEPRFLADASLSAIRQISSNDASEAFLCRDGVPLLLFQIADSVRAESADVISQIRNRLGLTVSILSGDSPEIVSNVANQVGVASDCALGGLTPEDKQEITSAKEERTPCAFVGDGANDAAALASCTIGIAVHGGAEVAMSVADVYLSTTGLSSLLELLDGAKRTLSVVKTSLLISGLYNLVGGTAAMLGFIGPLEAAILMPISSLTTIAVALLSKKFAAPSASQRDAQK